MQHFQVAILKCNHFLITGSLAVQFTPPLSMSRKNTLAGSGSAEEEGDAIDGEGEDPGQQGVVDGGEGAVAP